MKLQELFKTKTDYAIAVLAAICVVGLLALVLFYGWMLITALG